MLQHMSYTMLPELPYYSWMDTVYTQLFQSLHSHFKSSQGSHENWCKSVWWWANANRCFSKYFYFITSVRHLHYLWKLPVMGCLQLPWLTGFSQAIWKLLWTFPLYWHRISDGTLLRLQLSLTYKNAPKFSALLMGSFLVVKSSFKKIKK